MKRFTFRAKIENWEEVVTGSDYPVLHIFRAFGDVPSLNFQGGINVFPAVLKSHERRRHAATTRSRQ